VRLALVLGPAPTDEAATSLEATEAAAPEAAAAAEQVGAAE